MFSRAVASAGHIQLLWSQYISKREERHILKEGESKLTFGNALGLMHNIIQIIDPHSWESHRQEAIRSRIQMLKIESTWIKSEVFSNGYRMPHIGTSSKDLGNWWAQGLSTFPVYTVYIKHLSKPQIQEILRHKGKLLSGEESLCSPDILSLVWISYEHSSNPATQTAESSMIRTPRRSGTENC